MAWRNLAYGSQQAAEFATVVAPTANLNNSGKNASTSSSLSNDIPQSVGGKLYRVIEYLRCIPLQKPVSIQEIRQAIGVDLTFEEAVDQRLKNNPKVKVVGELYAYQAKYNVKDKVHLLKTIERHREGIPKDDIIDCYIGVEDDLLEFTRTGEIICIKNLEKAAEVYYPRVVKFLSKLSYPAIPPINGYVCRPSGDLGNEIRRGDAVQVGEHWFRVSPAVKTGQYTTMNPPPPMTGVASFSVSSQKDPVITKKIKYLYKFDDQHLPLDSAYSQTSRNGQFDMPLYNALIDEPPQSGTKQVLHKHGCTNDIRNLWNDVLRTWPTDRVSFQMELVKAGLATQDGLDVDRRLKKPRQLKKGKTRKSSQRSIKLSNQHLIGTQLGDILAKGNGEEFTLGATSFEKK